MVATTVLTEDAVSCGRFKRRSCRFVLHQMSVETNKKVALMNGGWAVVDPSVERGTEGQKTWLESPCTGLKISTNNDRIRSQPGIFTAVDEHVAQRLEYLAMDDVSMLNTLIYLVCVGIG